MASAGHRLGIGGDDDPWWSDLVLWPSVVQGMSTGVVDLRIPLPRGADNFHGIGGSPVGSGEGSTP
jgi:hypothetical protein